MNNEFVMVPRELAQEAHDELTSWDSPTAATLRALLAHPAAQHQGDQFTYSSKQETSCAGCGIRKHTPLRVDAMGGYVCLTCIDQKLEALLSQSEHQGEPVSLPERTTDTESCAALMKRIGLYGDVNIWRGGEIWNACLDEVAKLGPLYTHAATGEVAPSQIALSLQGKLKAVEQERDTLRAHLTERNALLREALEFVDSFKSGLGADRESCDKHGVVVWDRIQSLQDRAFTCQTPTGCACPGDGVGQCKRCPSARVEPSAPICLHGGRCWIDEHCGECPHSGEELAALYDNKEMRSSVCEKCAGTGEQDSGGSQPWGEPILVPCDCADQSAPVARDERE